MKPKILIGTSLLIIVVGAYILKVQSTTELKHVSTPPKPQATAAPVVQTVPAEKETMDAIIAKALADAKKAAQVVEEEPGPEILAKVLAENNLPSSHVFTAEERIKIFKREKDEAMEIFGKSKFFQNQIEQLLECPVEVYGQVLDENEQPIIGAVIKYNINPEGPMTPSFKVMSSAPDGRFEVKGLNAVAITLIIEVPPGYQRPTDYIKKIPIVEPLEVIKQTPEYKRLPREAQLVLPTLLMMSRPNQPTYKPDKSNPIIFRLKKL